MHRLIFIVCSVILIFKAFAAPEILFSDDFSQVNTKWVNGKQGNIIKGSYKLGGQKVSKLVWIKAGQAWKDYTVDFDVIVDRTQAGWVVRKNSKGYYLFLLQRPHLNRLIVKNGKYLPCGKTKLDPEIVLGKKVHVKIIVQGDVIKHYIDGRKVDELINPAFDKGSFGFRECGAETGIFDNVVIRPVKQSSKQKKSSKYKALAAIPFVEKAPVLDGKILAEEWKNATVLGPFSDLSGKPSRRPIKVRAMWDNKNLYLAFSSSKRFIRNIPKRKRDNSKIFADDAIEINLLPGGVHWYKFAFDPAGSRWDRIFKGKNFLKHSIWNPDWKVANHLIHDGLYVEDIWNAEAAIPFSELKRQTPKPGEKWAVQICRDLDNSEKLTYPQPERWTCWNLPRGGFNNPDNFGTFVFSRKSPIFQYGKTAKFEKGVIGFSGKIIGSFSGKAKVNVAAVIYNDPENILFQKSILEKSCKVCFRKVAVVPEKCKVLLQWKVVTKGHEIAAGEIVDIVKPPFAVTFAPLFTKKMICVDGDFTNLPAVPDSVVIEIVGMKSGKKIFYRKKQLSGTRKFYIPIKLREVLPGTCNVKAILKDSDGKIIAKVLHKIIFPVMPAWTKRKLKKMNTPLPGWMPLKTFIEKDRMVFSSWAKRYEYRNSVLPTGIELRGKPFLLAPAELNLNGKPLKIDSFKLEEHSSGQVKISWKGCSHDGTVNGIGNVLIGFDGLIWNRFKLEPVKAEADIAQLEIKLPLARKGLRYMRGSNNMEFLQTSRNRYVAFIGDAKITGVKYPQPADKGHFSTAGWRWTDKFCNFYWIGGLDRGLFTVFKSTRGMATNEYSKVEGNNKGITLTFPLINKHTTITSPINYEFGFIGTPVKKLIRRDRLNRVGFNCFYSYAPAHFKKALGRVWGSGVLAEKFFTGPQIKVTKGDVETLVLNPFPQSMLGNPYLTNKQSARLAKMAHRDIARGIKPLLWCDLTYTTLTMKNEFPFRYEWEQYPKRRQVELGMNTSLVCPQEAWHKFYLQGIEERMRQDKVKGVYLDMTGFGGCHNKYHGCGYVKNGKLEKEIPFMKMRNLFLRLNGTVKDNCHEGIIFQHCQMLSPTGLWSSVNTQGENWSGRKNYRTLSLPYYQAAYMTQHQYGVAFNFFATLNTPSYVDDVKKIVSLDEVVGLTLIHDTLPCGITSQQVPGLVTVWNALRDFGAYKDDTKWIPYWESGLGNWKKDIAVSYYQRGKRFFVTIFNSAYSAQKIELPASIFGHGKAHNVITGKQQSFSRLKLKSRQALLLIIEKQKSL